MADAGFLDRVTHTRNRAEDRIDRNNADLLDVGAVFRRRHIATTIFNHHLHDKWNIVSQVGDHQIFVDDLHGFVGFDVRGHDDPSRIPFDTQHFRGVAVVLHNERLDVENDVGHVFQQTWDRGEFVLSIVDFDLRHRAAFQTRKQHTTQSITHGRTKTALKRLGDEFTVSSR